MDYKNEKLLIRITSETEAKDILAKIKEIFREQNILSAMLDYVRSSDGCGVEILYKNGKVFDFSYCSWVYFITRDEFLNHKKMSVSEYINSLSVKKEPTLPTKKRKAYVEISKEVGKIFISLKIPSEVEDFFKNISDTLDGNPEVKIKTSEAWFQKEKGVQYYSQPKELEKKLTDIDDYVFSDFGSGLMRDDLINVSILRTVGASKGVKIHAEGFSSLTNADLQEYVRRLGLYIKRLWETNISSTRIKSVITFEI